MVLVISADLPFASSRFCAAEGLENVVTLSTMRGREFLRSYGVEIASGPLAGLAARAVVVLDENDTVVHARAGARDRAGAGLRRGARRAEVGSSRRLAPEAGELRRWQGQAAPAQRAASSPLKRNARDGRYYFVEMNPRLPWYNGIFADAGVNLPLAAYRDLTGQPVRQTSQRNGVHWLSGERTLRRQVGARGALAGSLAVLGAAASARSFAWWSWR